MRVTVLGCGAAGGVPLASGDWGDCDPTAPRNRRRRPSILIQTGGHRIVVDTGPDFREQMLAVGGGRVDAILYTHAHADHTHGIDDIRTFNWSQSAPIDAYGHPATLAAIERRFGYAFRPYDPAHGFIRPHLRAHTIDGLFHVGPVAVQAFEQEHGRVASTGYRVGDFAYSTDVSGLGEPAFAALRGVDVWMVSCIGTEPHPSHAHVEQALDWIARVRPRRALLTHMGQGLDYAALCRALPPGVEPAYDGLEIDL